MRQLLLGLAIACAMGDMPEALADLPPASICGQVFDATTGRPISGVHVESLDPSRLHDPSANYFQAITDSLGFYKLLAGTGTVTFIAVGYDTTLVEWREIRKPCGEGSADCLLELHDVAITPCKASTGRE